MKGKFYGVGVGPGDPELLTIKACRVLREADVICAPRSGAGREGVALSIVGGIIGEEKEVLELPFPMTRDREELERCWEEAAGRIAALLAEGKKVAFVTLGDPTLYSTYTYVLKKIREAGPWETETVPGVPSFCACAAMAGVPLAEGEEKLAVVPLLKDPEALPPLLQNFENVVVMKVGGRYGDVLAVLKSSGLAESSFLASRCGFPEGFVRRLAEESPAGAGGKEEGAGEGRKGRPDYLSLLIVKRAKVGPAKEEGEIGEGLFHRGGSGGPGTAHAQGGGGAAPGGHGDLRRVAGQPGGSALRRRKGPAV